ncbi:MAG TPA: aminopeptidase P N-terminal domain-containing protein, partial [Bacteroidales bacterium]|nr:aminopeptidase P N-terminal domain-containing protein [Bacteroidales bacterium]
MKHSFILLITIFLIAGCKKAADTNIPARLVPDINDLSMTENMQKIYSERQEKLMGQIEKGVVVLRSDCDFDGGRHEYRAANNFHYLTGFTEPGSVVVLTRDSKYPYILYIKERTAKEAIYNGEIPAIDSIMLTYRP